MTTAAPERSHGANLHPPVAMTLADPGDSSRPSVAVRVALALAAAAFVILRLRAAAHFRLTFDEVYTLETARRSLPSLLSYLVSYDEHPPLFYLIVKAWTLLGGVEYWWLGLLPALIAAATLAPLLLLCRALGMSDRDTACAVLLMALNGYVTGFAEELRPYSLLLLMTLSSLWLFVRMWNAGDTRAGALALALVNLLLVATHHYGWLVVATELAMVLFWRHPVARHLCGWTLATVLVSMPWLTLLAVAAEQRLAAGQRAFFYIPTPTMMSVVSFYGALSGATEIQHTLGVSLLVAAVPIGVCLWALRRARDNDQSRPALVTLVLLAAVPVIVGFIVSKVSVGTAIWGQRHFITAAGPFFLLVASGSGRIRPLAARRVVTAIVVVWTGWAGWISFTMPYKAAAWDQLAEHMIRAESDRHGPVMVYASTENAALPLRFYLARLGAPQFQVVVVEEDTPENRRIFDGAGPRPYWAVDQAVLLRANGEWPACAHCWIAVSGPNDLARAADAGLTVGDGFSDVLVNRRNRVTVSVHPASSLGSLGEARFHDRDHRRHH